MEALFKISYGLYVLSAAENGKDNACIIDAFSQVTSTEPYICVANVNKHNLTHDMIHNTKKFNISVLTKDAPFALYHRFGLQSGKDVDKFDGFADKETRSKNGLLYLTKHTNAFMSFQVTGAVDFGTHTMFTAELTDSAVLNGDESVTYHYYRQYIKPKPQGSTGWVCEVCGYVHESGDLPPDYVCPLCKAPASAFKKQTGIVNLPFADEHRIGIAKDAAPEIIEGLRMNFLGECTEVGMYLAMSRQADREGYPQIANAYQRIAFEEAEHAAKFAELLGEVVDASTQKNLEKRVLAEHGATQGKLDLAQKAKALNLDAIHDTVHEMCKDEARHGKAFQGLLNRYFK